MITTPIVELPTDDGTKKLFLAGKVVELAGTFWLNPNLLRVVKEGTFSKSKDTLGEMLLKKGT